MLNGKRILIGISGGIAAYKTLSLIRLLKKAGALVRVILTENAKHFVTPTSIQALSGLPPHDDLWDSQQEAAMGHIELARWADLFIIAPATAATLGRAANALADNLLITTLLATEANVIFYPAMNQAMWHAKPTQVQVSKLIEMGYTVIEPLSGEQACGDVGVGRLPEPETIFETILQYFNHSGPLKGVTAVVTAGPTQERIDPVRYISNRSSGKMGFALAEALIAAGANVTLISGPSQLPTPKGVLRLEVLTALEMQNRVHTAIKNADIFIGAAAVADYRPLQPFSEKIKKGQSDTLTVKMIKNPDIIKEVALMRPKPWVIGFAAETNELRDNAYKKLTEKNLDMIIANQVGEGVGFDVDTNEVFVVTHKREIHLSQKSKIDLAHELVKIITKELPHERNHD